MDVFLENFRRGGGSFPIQKITLQILLVSKGYILEKKRNVISKKEGRGGGVIANPKNVLANLRKITNFLEKAQCNFQKGTGGGGGERGFENFPKKHPFLGRRSPLST